MNKELNLFYESLLKEEPSIISNIDLNHKNFAKVSGYYILFLSLSVEDDRAMVIKAKGTSLKDALKNLYETYIKNKNKEFELNDIKLDILTDITQLKYNENESSGISVDRGVDGITFDESFTTSLSPQEVEVYNVIQNQDINFDRLNNALINQLSNNSSISNKDINYIYKFKTKSFFINENEVIELKRGHRTFNNLNKDEIFEAIKLTRDNYFMKSVKKKGKLIYSYLPTENVVEKRYNVLRHSGTINSMLETYEIMPNSKLFKKIENAIAFLIDSIQEVNINDKNAKVLVERDINKLGGNALTLVALTKYMTLTNNKEHLSTLQDLATWIKEVQHENGDFSIHKQIYSTGEVTSFRSDFYMGEAILGLVRLYELDLNEEWLDIAESAANFLINVKNEGATLETVHHDHWLLYGLNNIYKYRKKKLYLDYAYLMAESIMNSQFFENVPNEWIGGFPPQIGNAPKSVPVACRTEGLGNVYEMAKTNGDLQFASLIKDTIINAVQFQLQMQLRPEKVMYFENKQLCLGAFQNKFKVIELRNDFTQHNISSLVALYKIMDE